MRPESGAPRRLLLVCTGNTCRSPMAAALLRSMLADRLGPEAAARVGVASAGLQVAEPGGPAAPHARQAMRERGLSLEDHRARQLEASDLAGADLVLTMTRQHLASLRCRYPEAADRLYALREYGAAGRDGEGDIADPYGGDLATYRACAAQLAEELSRLVELIYACQSGPGEESCVPTMEIAAPTAVRRLAAGADHAGFQLKAELVALARDLGVEVADFGTADEAACDYPDFAARVARAVADGACDAGLLVCGTGLGMAIAANKVPGIRAVTVNDPYLARLAREHNDANVACIGARIAGPGLAAEVLRVFLATPWSGEQRHARRVGKIAALEYPGQGI